MAPKGGRGVPSQAKTTGTTARSAGIRAQAGRNAGDTMPTKDRSISKTGGIPKQAAVNNGVTTAFHTQLQHMSGTKRPTPTMGGKATQQNNRKRSHTSSMKGVGPKNG